MYRERQENAREPQPGDGGNAPLGAGRARIGSTGRRSRYWTDAVQRLRPLSISEAALAARCHRSDIERRIEQGDLHVIQRGSRRYIRQEDLKLMLEKEAQVSPESKPARFRGNGRRASINRNKIDPHLREFFD